MHSDDLAASSGKPSANSSFNFDQSVLCVGAGLNQASATDTDASTEHDWRLTTDGRHARSDHWHAGFEKQERQVRKSKSTPAAGEECTLKTGTHADVAEGADLTGMAASGKVVDKTESRQT